MTNAGTKQYVAKISSSRLSRTLKPLQFLHTGEVQTPAHGSTTLPNETAQKSLRKSKEVGAVVAHVSSLSAANSLLIMTYTGEKLQNASPRPLHRPPETPRRPTLCVMTYRREKRRSAPLGPRYRPPRTPIRCTLSVMNY